MGTSRLSPYPRSKKWKQILGLFVAGAGSEQIAREALEEILELLQKAAKDAVLIEVIRMLMLLPLAARSDDFAGYMRGVGLDIDDEPEFFEILDALSTRLDSIRLTKRERSDLAEMAQPALAETLTATVGQSLNHLFDTTPDEVQAAFARLKSASQFGKLAACFFGKLLGRCLDSVLSRAIPSYVGPGERLVGLSDYSQFTKEMKIFCQETASIVEGIAGDWYSKECFEQGGEIDNGRVFKFAYGAFAKLGKQLQKGAI